ncbi:hypothetical protein [Prolixibacter denitrificans]|uniref:Outer membrane protein with beta-barrel domain n=1 Tax=Prolixibacter denitrificans TaxID=1541063 RepID=A0A2P8CAL0_9BACT|nr:hypothetical protein [Prolixibacter denitrificans]PSK82009.1 hypothetical protein CLV93_107122 [Prolixibacter denitrificans]GET22605.1 hypothetical protein JCM18694_28510 [Prolixibacter denitrificans]
MCLRQTIKRIFSIILILSLALAANAQFVPKLAIVGGLGVPELYHAGLKLQTSPRSEFGIYYGFIYASSHNSSGWFRDFELNMRSLTLDHSYFFGKVSPLSHRRSWFTQQGLNYYHEVGGRDDTFSGMLTIGRKFPFSDAAGLALDIGTAIPFSNRKNIIPAARLQVYILLSKPPIEK